MLRRLVCSVGLALVAACTEAPSKTDGQPSTDPGSGAADLDGDGWSADDDCDDTDPRINPAADERCDGIDNNCDGRIDPETSVDARTFYTDADADGWGDENALQTACSSPSGTAERAGDCDDTDATRHPDATEVCGGTDEDCDGLEDDADPSLDLSTADAWHADADADGFGSSTSSTWACVVPSGFVADATDCDDSTDAVHPDAPEVCDDLDNDCDGLIDDDDPSVDESTVRTFYADADADGHGAGDPAFTACSGGEGFVPNADDCDDTNADLSPSAQEVCDDGDIDEDCDGLSDDLDPSTDATTTVLWFPDTDADGYGDGADAGTALCDAPTGSSTAWQTDASDCDDTDPTVHPDATEVCDAADQDEDCDGLSDDDDPSVDATTQSSWSPDADGDGFGDASVPPTDACDEPASATGSYVVDATDCDDADASIHPMATEVCDPADVDEDCDGLSDDADSSVDISTGTDHYPDLDGDGHGDEGASAVVFCDLPASGYATTDDDCDDDDAQVNPSAAEVCSAKDDDCDPTTGQASMVRFVDSTGVETDLATSWSAGTSGSPVDWTSPSDGTLWICADTWTVHLVVDGHSLDIIGPDGAASTVLDADENDAVVYLETGTSVSIEGLTLQNGDAVLGGGISGSGVSLVLEDSVIADCSADDGGGVYLENSEFIATNVQFLSNTASGEGGGVYIDGETGSGHTLTSCTFSQNDAGNHGGGMYLKGHPSVTLDTLDFTDNTATADGGGLYQNDGELTILDGTFHSNDAGDDGGGLLAKDTTTVTDTDLTDNTAVDSGAGAYLDLGESEAVSFTSTTSAACQLNGNTAGNRGDAIYVKLANRTPSPTLDVTNVDFDFDTVRVNAKNDATLSPGNGASLTCAYTPGCTTP